MSTIFNGSKTIVIGLLALVYIFVLPDVSFAEPSETEPNDSATTATPMDLNTWYTGNAHDWDDDDYYKFTLPLDGNIEVSFNNDGELSAKPDIYVLNGNNEMYAEVEGRGDLVGDETAFVSLPKGVYYIKVDNYYDYDFTYKIKVDFTAGDFYEKEFNNNFYTATPITLGKEYIGSTSYYNDDDYYKIKLDKPGKLNVCFNNDEVPNGASEEPNIYVLDGRNTEYLKISGNSDLLGAECANIGLDKGEYYIKIDANTYNSYYYKLSTSFTPDNYYEKEINDDTHSATLMQLNKKYQGELNYYSDKDYYRFSLPTSKKLTIKLDYNAHDDAEMRVELIDGQAKEHLEFVSNGKSYESTDVLPAGDYFIKLDRYFNSYYRYNYSLSIIDEPVERISGYSRYDTAIEISKEGWDSANTVVLSRGDNFADALAGVPLAHKLEAPILMTPGNKLWDNSLAEMKRLGARNVVILGGEVAVSKAVSDKLEKEGLNVRRISGHSRYDTAALIAEEVAPGGTGKVVVANGQDFPDALSVASHAAKQGLPILLTQANILPKATNEAIKDLGAKETIVVGGEVAVSKKVASSLPKPTRLSGHSRYDTNVAIAKHFGVSSKHLYVATGKTYADALTGAVLAAKNDSAILLVHHAIPELTSKYISDQGAVKLSIFGGEVAINKNVENGLRKLLP